MKKIQISIFILLSILLTSCSNEWELWLDIKENTIKTEKQEINQEIADKINTENQEIDEIKQITNNKELVKHKDWNIYLYENWKQIDYLTSKAKKCGTNEIECINEVKYDIINSNWKYWIVEKNERFWECWEKTFYWINLNTNAVLLDKIYTNSICFLSLKANLNWWKLIISVEYPKYIVDRDVIDKWEIGAEDIKQDWFIKKWDNWVKEIEISDFVKNKIIEEVKENNNNKYSHNNLIKDWYKLNKLWSINEYYKKISYDNNQPQNEWWLVDYKTIYIKWDKVLEITANYREYWWTSWFSPSISISDWTNTKTFFWVDIWEWEYFSPIQPIFKIKQSSKLIVDTELNTIKIVNKNVWVNKTLWKR